MGRLYDIFNYGSAFGAVALKQLLIAMTAQHKLELPNQIPDIMQPGIHPLPTKGAVNMSGIAGDEETPDAQMRHLAMVNAK